MSLFYVTVFIKLVESTVSLIAGVFPEICGYRVPIFLGSITDSIDNNNQAVISSVRIISRRLTIGSPKFLNKVRVMGNGDMIYIIQLVCANCIPRKERHKSIADGNDRYMAKS